MLQHIRRAIDNGFKNADENADHTSTILILGSEALPHVGERLQFFETHRDQNFRREQKAKRGAPEHVVVSKNRRHAQIESAVFDMQPARILDFHELVAPGNPQTRRALDISDLLRCRVEQIDPSDVRREFIGRKIGLNLACVRKALQLQHRSKSCVA